MKKLVPCLLVVILATILSTVALAAGLEKNSLKVHVTDTDGTAIALAKVSLQNEKGRLLTSTTGEHGEVLFDGLLPGKYRFYVESEHFAPYNSDLIIQPGSNKITIILETSTIYEEVEVRQDEREKQTDPRGNAFTTILTESQIADLPDDPEEMASALKRIAGPGANISVDGFAGGRLPPKSQIRQIRFRYNVFAAEYHALGFVGIEINTKPGIANLHGTFAFSFLDEALNARQAFLPKRTAEQTRHLDAALDIPIYKNRTSLFLFADGGLSYDIQTIVATLPAGINLRDSVLRPNRNLYTSLRAIHALTKTHTLTIQFERDGSNANNLGVGGFNLPERAYSLRNDGTQLRIADSGPFGNKLFNELRLQINWRQSTTQSTVNTPAIVVLNAFSSGGGQIEDINSLAKFEFTDNLAFAVKQHALRTGVSIEAGNYKRSALYNGNGTFIFSSLDDFIAARPITFSQRVGRSPFEFPLVQFSGYFQDDWRVRSNFTLSSGIRYEKQNQLRDSNNIAPRLGFAWSPFKNGRTSIRGGVGIFYDWFNSNTISNILNLDGERQFEIVIRNPGFPNPFSSGTQIQLPPSKYQKDINLHNPYSLLTSLSLQKQVLQQFSLIATYSYQRGVRLLRSRDINAPIEELGRPNPLVGNLFQVESTAQSTTHRFNMIANSVSSKRLNWFVSYTLLNIVNDTDGAFSLPASSLNLRNERGSASEDIRHSFFANVGLQLTKGVRCAINLSSSSAPPYNITTGRDDNGDTISNDRPIGITRNSARGAANIDLSTRLSWSIGFGKTNGRSNASGTRTLIVSSGDQGAINSELAAQEKKWRVNFYIQASNLLNKVNLINFTGVQTSPFFGRATEALPGRRIETGMRFSF